jgi:hypothetical protein
MKKTRFKLRRIEDLGLSVSEIALKMGVSIQIMKVALKLQDATGISHQFFMYPVPTALQFSGANNNGIK